MRNSNIETEEQNLIFPESLPLKDNNSKQRKSILKNRGIAYTESNALSQSLLKDNDPFSKKSKRNIVLDDLKGSTASMAFEGE